MLFVGVTLLRMGHQHHFPLAHMLASHGEPAEASCKFVCFGTGVGRRSLTIDNTLQKGLRGNKQLNPADKTWKTISALNHFTPKEERLSPKCLNVCRLREPPHPFLPLMRLPAPPTQPSNQDGCRTPPFQ